MWGYALQADIYRGVGPRCSDVGKYLSLNVIGEAIFCGIASFLCLIFSRSEGGGCIFFVFLLRHQGNQKDGKKG